MNRMGDGQVERRLAAILAADVVGYSRLMEANEERTLGALRQHRREFFDPTVIRNNGRIFKVMGDGFLVEFGSVIDAARCAVEIQSGMPARNVGVPEDRHIRFRIGLNLGDVIVDGDDLNGDGVNMAARLEGLALPGGIACSATVRMHVGNKLEVEFLDQGEKTVKNIAQPVHVYFLNPGLPAASSGAGKGTQPATRTDKPSVAVLPFANMSNDPEQAFFSDGITEDIITDLSKVSGLFVLSRNTVFLYKGKAVGIEQVARELGVSHVVEGSVRKAGNRVRINAQLIEGATGGHVWADRYDRDLTDIFAVQDEIARTVVDQLKVKLLPAEKTAIEQAPTANVDAYTSYLKGRELFHLSTKAGLAEAKEMFAKAIALDPLYARAYAGAADCNSFLYIFYGHAVSTDDILANCDRALALDPNLAEARASRGLVLSAGQRYDEAEVEFRLALAGNPDLFEAHYFWARSCFVQGRLEEAITHWARAAEVKPDDYSSAALQAPCFRSLGRMTDHDLALQRGMDRAERAFAKNPQDSRAAYFIANSLAALGQAEKAVLWIEKALAFDPDDSRARYNAACVYALCGEPDRAFDLLEPLLQQPTGDVKAWTLNDSDLDALHELPRWQNVLRLVQ